MIIYLSLLVAIAGVLMYALCVNPKLAEIGRLSFFADLFVFLFQSVPQMVKALG